MQHHDDKQSYPEAEGGALPPSLRKHIDALLEPGVRVWVYAPSRGDWVQGTVDNTALLEDRCLFEIKTDVHVGSSFLDGYGLSAHSAYHGIDWFVLQSESPPPPHPLSFIKEFQYGSWFSYVDEDGELLIGEVTEINAARKYIEIRIAEDPMEQRDFPERVRFPFHELSEVELWSSDLDQLELSSLDRVLLDGVAYEPKAIDAERELLGLTSVDLLSKGRTIVVPWYDLDQRCQRIASDEAMHVFREFPQLLEDKEHVISFRDGDSVKTGKTPFHESTASLPAYLEVLIEKSYEELLEENSGRAPDVYHRFRVHPDDILSVS